MGRGAGRELFKERLDGRFLGKQVVTEERLGCCAGQLGSQ